MEYACFISIALEDCSIANASYSVSLIVVNSVNLNMNSFLHHVASSVSLYAFEFCEMEIVMICNFQATLNKSYYFPPFVQLLCIHLIVFLLFQNHTVYLV